MAARAGMGLGLETDEELDHRARSEEPKAFLEVKLGLTYERIFPDLGR